MVRRILTWGFVGERPAALRADDAPYSRSTTNDGHETTISSMEILRVVDGRITEVWNCSYQQGVWQ
jgi:hypothetical protein